MTFRVGQKVVCIDDTPRNGSWIDIVKGEVYEVAGFGRCQNGGLGLVLVERPDWQYFHNRFRPIVERKTDISIFTRMLNPSKVEA